METSSEIKACPYCAETIKSAARICRFCNREIEGQQEITTSAEIEREILKNDDVLITDEPILKLSDACY